MIFLRYSLNMASVMDLPPELVNLIVLHLVDLNTPLLPNRHAKEEPSLCPCYDDTTVKGHFPRHVGPDRDAEEGDVARFGSAHPHIKKCIEQSGYHGMVELWATSRGVFPSVTTTIPSIIRQVHHSLEAMMIMLTSVCSHSKGQPTLSFIHRHQDPTANLKIPNDCKIIQSVRIFNDTQHSIG